MTGDELDRAIQFLVESQAKVTSDIAQLTGDVTQLTGEVAQVTRDVAQLTGEVAQVTHDVAQLTGEVAQVTHDVAQLTGDVTQLRGDHADLRDWMGRFAQTTQLFAEQADGRMERLDTAMAEVAERMNALIRVVEGHVTDETQHRTPPPR